jgi:hypothetical protein
VKPRTLAVQLAKADLFIFQKLTIDNITSGSGDALPTLNARWNSICRAAEECSTAGQSFDLQLAELVQVDLSFLLALASVNNNCRSFIASATFTL